MHDTKITKDRIRNHFTYSWWKYALLAIVAVFGWNLFYTSTAYRAPKDKRLDIYFVTHSVASETLDWMRETMLAEFPQLEDAGCMSIVYTDDDNYYGSIQLTTYIGAGEGDVLIMSRERFNAFRDSDVFLPLDDSIDSGLLDVRGIDVSSTKGETETGIRGTFGVPAGTLYGLMDIGVDNRDLVIGVTAYSKNQATAVAFVNWLVETMEAPEPEWLAEQRAQQEATRGTEEVSEIPSY